MEERHITMDTGKAPRILVFKICAIAIFVDLKAYLILASLNILRNIKL